MYKISIRREQFTEKRKGKCTMKKKMWFYVLVIGVMTLSTVCYIAIMRNAKTTYANGKFVEQEGIDNEARYYLFKTGTE